MVRQRTDPRDDKFNTAGLYFTPTRHVSHPQLHLPSAIAHQPCTMALDDLLFAIFWATPSSAQMFDDSDAMYVGVSYGRLLANQMSQSTINQALQQQGLAVTTLSAEDRSAGGKVFAGYRLHPNWALELAYTDLGSYNFNGLQAIPPITAVSPPLTLDC